MSSVLQGDTLYVTLIDDVYAMPAYRSVPPILKTTLIVPEHIALEVHSNHELVTIKPRIIANHWTISDAGAVDAYMHTNANATLYAENVSEIIGEEAKWEITESPLQQEEQVEQSDNYETNSNVKLGTLTIGNGANRIQILNSSSLSVSLIHTE